MARCSFCNRHFASAQAVRAHLKGCGAYKGNLPREKMPRETRVAPLSDRARHFQGEVQAEQARLSLREIKARHAELDRAEAERTRREREAREEARRRERERVEAQARADARAKAEARAREDRELDAWLSREYRRHVIQGVKDRALSGYGAVPEGVRAEARIAVQRALAGLDLDEVPEDEILGIAKAVADKVCRPAAEAQECEREPQQADLLRTIREIGEAARRSLQSNPFMPDLGEGDDDGR